jgi:predicted transposase/invertase (TIGR01784 family)
LKTDSLFYEIFQTDPNIVFDLIGRPPARNVIYRFASQEVKQTSFRIDGILVPPTDAIDLPIVFVEVQGYRDRNNVLYSSFFSQLFLYLHDYQPRNDWHAVLIFTQRNLDSGLPSHYRVFEGSSQFQRIYLDELNEATNLSLGLSVLRLIGLEQEVAPAEGRELVERTRSEVNDAEMQQKFIELIETILVYKFSQLSREEIAAMLRLDDLKQTRVYRDALEEGLQAGRQEGLQAGRQEGLQAGRQEGLQAGRQEGLQAGRQEGLQAGRQEGRQEGKLAAVPLLLKAGVTIEQIAEQLQVDLAAVQRVADQL